jgi:hypothetical protein
MRKQSGQPVPGIAESRIGPRVFKFEFLQQEVAATILTRIARGDQVIRVAGSAAFERNDMVDRSRKHRQTEMAILVSQTPPYYLGKRLDERFAGPRDDRSGPAEPTSVTVTGEHASADRRSGHPPTSFREWALEDRKLCPPMDCEIYRSGNRVAMCLKGTQIRVSKQVGRGRKIASQQGVGSPIEQVRRKIVLRNWGFQAASQHL